jgi:hypothetical protein
MRRLIAQRKKKQRLKRRIDSAKAATKASSKKK